MRSYFASLSASLRYRPLASLFACSAALGTGYFAPIYYDTYKRRSQPSLNSSTFTPFALIAKHRISSSSAIFVLRAPSSDATASKISETWDADSLWSVQAKQPQLQIGREYTPLPPSAVLDALSGSGRSGEDRAGDIHLLIRREKKGEMTTYLHGLQPPSAAVNLRGPYSDVRIPEHVDEVLFIAGGTGISPALQVAHIMSRRPGAKVTILWANRRKEECALAPVSRDSVVSPSIWTRLKRTVAGGSADTSAAAIQPEANTHDGTTPTQEKGIVVQILEDMQARSPNLRVEYFVDEEDSFIKHTDIRTILARSSSSASSSSEHTSTSTPQTDSPALASITHQHAAAASTTPTTGTGTGTSSAKLILVGGPNGFVDYWAGRKRMREGKEVQGPLGGALGEMELHGWRVWKL